jgi:hypothetical protein
MTHPFAHLTARLSCAALLLGSLTACQITQTVSDPVRSQPAAGESPVVVSITSNTAQLESFDTLELTRLSPRGMAGAVQSLVMQNYSLRRAAPGMARDTSVFIGRLPAGEYYLTKLHNGQTMLKLGSASSIGVFTVAADSPVDLGRVIITPMASRILVGRSARVTANGDLLRRYSPEHARLFAGPTAPGWNGPRDAADRVEEFALSRPIGADCMSELADGRVVAASRMGTLLLREKTGRWDTLRAPGIESLLCVLPVQLPDADLLAVGEFGALLRHAPGAATLAPVDTGNLPPGNLLRIVGNPAAGWYIAHQGGDTVTIFHSRQLERGTWTVLTQAGIGGNLWNGANKFTMWPTREGFAWNVSGSPLHFYDFASGRWTDRPLPDNRRLISMEVSPTNLLSVVTKATGFGSVFGKVHVSGDDGRSWTEVASPFSIKDSPVVQLPDGSMLLDGGVSGKTELHASSDGGKTWHRHADYLPGRYPHAFGSGLMIDASSAWSGISSLRSSSDGGRNWTVEYSTFDPAALGALLGSKSPARP